jgi:hypothetical protein
MRRLALSATAALLALIGAAEAQTVRKAAAEPGLQGNHPRSSYYHRAPQVRGFIQRRGGYSFTRADLFNTYGDSRTSGATNSFRDPYVDRQTSSGPFDHGFFFDSGIAPRGGNSPYPN